MSSNEEKKKRKKKKEKFEDEIVENDFNEMGGSNLPVAAAVPIIILFFFLGLLLGGFFLHLGKSSKGKQCPTVSAKDKTLPEGRRLGGNGKIMRVKLRIPADAPYVGPKNAPVTIAVFEDFKCPWCKKATVVIDKILKQYPKQVRFVLMNFPLARHKGAQEAAEAGLEAMAQGKFKQLKAKMFANARQLSKENIIKWAGEVGMDTAKLKAALDSKKYAKAVKGQQLAGRFIGVRGTPTILVNGRKFNMTRDPKQTEASFKKMISEELSIIKKRRIPTGQAWAALTRNGVKNLAALSSRGRNSKNNRKKPRRPRTRKVVDPNVVYKVERDFSKDPAKGGKAPLVTIVEFSDFQCPYCQRAEKTIDKIVETYKEDVRVIFLNNPLRFHKNAMPAAEAAMEVLAQKGVETYWKFHKYLFDHRKELSPENLEKWAVEIAKVDLAKYKKAISTHAHKAYIMAQTKFGQQFGVRGTPAFFINGYFLSGARPFPSFKAIIDREIAKAKKVVASGKAKRADYYGFIMKPALAKAKYIEQKIPQRKRRQRPRLDTTKVYKIDPIEKVPFIGDPNGTAVMAIGFDVQCPYCKRIFAIIEQLLEGDKAQFPGYKSGLKVVLLHFPLSFHKFSQLGHEAMQEVFEQKGPKVFYQYIKKLEANQRNLPRDVLAKFAKELGVDMVKFNNSLDKHTHAAFIKKISLLGRNIGVMGTPAVYLNGKSVRGRSLPLYRKLIDQAMATASTYIKAHPGVTAANYYKTIMKTATPKAVWIKPGAPAGKPLKRIRPGKGGIGVINAGRKGPLKIAPRRRPVAMK